MFIYLRGKPIAEFQTWGINEKCRMMDGKNTQREVKKCASLLDICVTHHDPRTL
jgi:hypothetical protein